MGLYKRTQTAALRQAKYYLPWQAAAARLLPRCSRPAAVEEGEKRLVYCGSSTAAPSPLFNYINYTIEFEN